MRFVEWHEIKPVAYTGSDKWLFDAMKVSTFDPIKFIQKGNVICTKYNY